MSFQIEMLVLAKAYPNVSQKYGEVVCVAGIRTDVMPHRWVRLWPVPFRDMAFASRFKKYQYIKLEVEDSNDPRPESLRPIIDSIVPGQALNIGKRPDWAARKTLIEPFMLSSMCEIRRRQRQTLQSLGVFRPTEVIRLQIDPEASGWDSAKQARIDQPSLMMPGKAGLERIPYRFRYHYRCASPGCRTHHQSVIDWELGQAFRRWRDKYGSEKKALELIEHKWIEEMCAPTRDTAFFVGNQYENPEGFLVLGVFWPPRDG